MVERLPTARKPLFWMGSALDDLSVFPDEVQQVMGYAIYLAEIGDKHQDAKPLRGDPAFKGAGVLEVVDRFDSDTYRAVYSVKFSGVVYVLHTFQKKSKSGTATPLQDIRRIKERLKAAREHHEANFAPQRKRKA